MNKTAIGISVVGALVVFGLIWKATRENPVLVELVTVTRGDVRASVSNTRAGTVDTCNRARMAPIMSGQIASLPVSEGDSVKQGQVLVELWNDDLRAQLHLAEEERRAATARADESCTVAFVARREADRFENLREQKLTSEERADAALGEANARNAACRAMRSMIKVSEAKVDLATAHLEQTLIRAPFSGTVAEINGEIGEVVTPSPVGVATLPAVDLIDNSCIFITAPIDEVDAPSIRAGMEASVSLDAFPDQVFSATITRVAPYVLAVEKQARTLDIEAEVQGPSEILLPGYSADIEVTLDLHTDVLRIPTQAVIGNEKVLLLDAKGILREQSISTGLSNWQVTEVVDGLAENQQVVLSVNREGVAPGVAAIADGDQD